MRRSTINKLKKLAKKHEMYLRRIEEYDSYELTKVNVSDQDITAFLHDVKDLREKLTYYKDYVNINFSIHVALCGHLKIEMFFIEPESQHCLPKGFPLK